MPTSKIFITLPDGSKKEYHAGVTALEIAKGIGERLARDAVAAKVNDELVDLKKPIHKDAMLKILTFKDKEGKGVFWHSASHLMSQAVQRVFKDQDIGLGVGFDVEDGFYQDYGMETLHPDMLEKIEQEMKKIVEEKLQVEQRDISKKQALEFYKKDPYKTELTNDIPGNIVSMYKQGEFDNLCKGPHVPNTSCIKAFKLMKIAGAYWRGDSKNAQLQRIYGVAFPNKDELKAYLHLLEQASLRDHRKLGKELDLISFHEESPGSVFYHPKGTVIFNELQKFVREEYLKRGFSEVVTPLVYDKSLWLTSGHWEHYKEHMFTLNVDGREVSLKPMNCPSHCLIYKTSTKSYRDLPLRIADFASLHRNELKGVLGGMTRVRKFNQDDAHIFCTIEQLSDELNACMDFANFVYNKVFKMEYHLELSTKPEKSLGSEEQWKIAEDALKNALEQNKDNDGNRREYKINPGDGAFYGPKIDLHIKDALGRSWQLSTIQVDFQLPGRFGLTYEGADGKKHTPIMVHRAVLGSLDRFIGILIEHFAGKFPLWLSPVQVRLLTVADRFDKYAHDVAKKYKEAGLRVEVDDRTESIGRKVREAQLAQVNYILVVGEQEVNNGTVTVRRRDNTIVGEKKAEEFLQEALGEVKERRV